MVSHQMLRKLAVRMNKPQLPLQLNISKAAGFDDFIGHDEVVNSLKNPSELPLFCYLWGAACAGKSHLLSAYMQHRQQSGESGALFSARVLVETEISDMMQPHWSFLMFDDVHMIAGNAHAERHFFNVFNTCRSQKIPLVVASQIAPRDSDWTLPDLRSRLQSGLTLTVSVLKGQKAMDLFKRQFKNQGIPTDEAVYKYIAGHHATDYASLDCLLQKLSALSLRDKRKITVPFVKRVMAEK